MTQEAPIMSEDEAALWTEAAKELTPPKSLARLDVHQQFLVSNLSLVGTLLAVAGGITGAITSTLDVAFYGVPVVPVGAFTASILSGMAVTVVLLSKIPQFDYVNINNIYEVRAYFFKKVEEQKKQLRIASSLFVAAVATAVVVSAMAGINTIAGSSGDRSRGSRNQAALVAAVGDGGAVSVQLIGQVTNLAADQEVRAVVTSVALGGRVVISNVVTYADNDGSVAFDVSAQASVGSTQADCVVTVVSKEAEDEQHKFSVTYPEVLEK